MIKRLTSLLLIILLVALIFTGCHKEEQIIFSSMEDFSHAKIGVLTGSFFDLLSREYFPEAEKLCYMNITDLILNLKQEKIHGILMDLGFFAPLHWDSSELSYLQMDMPATEYAVAFPKNQKSQVLCNQINEFIRTQTENGWLATQNEKWFGDKEPDGSIDLTSLSGENGTLRIATTVESKPFCYQKNGAFCGFDLDFIYRFAQEYGYALEIESMDFGAILPSLNAERYDLAISSITVTDERKEAVLFSDIYCRTPIVMAILSENRAEGNQEDTQKIGILTGSAHENTAKDKFPEAERVYFSNMTDMFLALQQEKIDCFLEDIHFVSPLIWEGLPLKALGEPVSQMQNGFIFPQIAESKPLREEINAFLAQATQDGTIEQLYAKWTGDSEPAEDPDYTSLRGTKGTIRLAIATDNKPMLYQRGDRYTGFEMELLTLFAKQAGYTFDIEVVPFESIIAGIASGKYDMGASSLNITEEREQSVDFCDPYRTSDVVLVVKNKDISATMTLADLETATLGIVTGTSWDLISQREFPNAERKYFASDADVLLALSQGKVDVFFADKIVYSAVRWESDAYAHLDEPIGDMSNALIFAKDNYDKNLYAQVNTFIDKIIKDGTQERLMNKWFGDKEPDEHPDYTKLTGENGTLRVATGDSNKPVAYQKGSMYTGYDIEFLTLFAQEYGYKLELQGMQFDALIPSVASGKYDLGACGIAITPERAQSVTFTDPNFTTYGIAIVYTEPAQSTDSSLAAFENATIGILSGSSFDALAKERFPNAERMYYTLVPDMILAAEQGKIDGYLSEVTYLAAALWEGAKLEAIDEVIDCTNAGYIFQKDGPNTDVREQLDAFIRKARESGLLDELYAKWLGSAEPKDIFDASSLTGENGTLKVALSPDMKPMGYIRDGEVTGYEVEVLQHFAKEYGYQLEFNTMTFDAILPGVVAGKYDIGAGGITITEERAKSVDFSESYLTVDVVMVVKAQENASAEPNFWDEVQEDFEKTFIREDRWKLILQGIGVTMLISLSAAAAGSLLGFGLYMLSRSEVKLLRLLAKGIAKVYSRIVAGTPVVVILMILFYVIFGKIRDMSGIVVSIIGFTLTFGAFVYDHMSVSVGSVDRGQTEAAYALGYTKNQTFFRIIFPQAMTIFLPSYCGQAVELIKATAVVGYVAVNDLTKMGDIIRSNTYEAFFPLIATAVIYFLLTWLLSALLGLVKLHFEPKRRKKEEILKGVKTV